MLKSLFHRKDGTGNHIEASEASSPVTGLAVVFLVGIGLGLGSVGVIVSIFLVVWNDGRK
jgi:hypothetical protein